MQKIPFHTGWKLRKGVADPFEAALLKDDAHLWRSVVLPHDAMIEEERDPLCKNGKQTGFYPSGAYTYVKEFTVPSAWEGKALFLEFEGVMARAIDARQDSELSMLYQGDGKVDLKGFSFQKRKKEDK